MSTPAEVMNYIFSNGLTAEQTIVELVQALPQFDVNVQWVNDILIQGIGAPPEHWRPT